MPSVLLKLYQLKTPLERVGDHAGLVLPHPVLILKLNAEFRIKAASFLEYQCIFVASQELKSAAQHFTSMAVVPTVILPGQTLQH